MEGRVDSTTWAAMPMPFPFHLTLLSFRGHPGWMEPVLMPSPAPGSWAHTFPPGWAPLSPLEAAHLSMENLHLPQTSDGAEMGLQPLFLWILNMKDVIICKDRDWNQQPLCLGWESILILRLGTWVFSCGSQGVCVKQDKFSCRTSLQQGNE